MTPMPPPCQHCKRPRLSTGLCPHCEHIKCVYCDIFMPIIEYADHCRSHYRTRIKDQPRPSFLFWWQIATDYPAKCPDCESILNNDGTCPEALRDLASYRAACISRESLLDGGS